MNRERCNIFEDDTLADGIAILNEMVKDCRRIVFFGGAGVSTESGIPDFRSEDGLYNQKYDYPPEEILSRRFFDKHPDVFYKFYRNKILVDNVQPNLAHYKLAEWEKRGVLRGIVTQNIDGLHQKAGSKKVYEIHGTINTNYCVKCGKVFDLDYLKKTEGVPVCDECGGIVKPRVVLYGEQLPEYVVNDASNAIAEADMLIVGGTSLNVYPAASLIQWFHGDKLVVVNRDRLKIDENADLVLHGSIGKIFSQLD